MRPEQPPDQFPPVDRIWVGGSMTEKPYVTKPSDSDTLLITEDHERHLWVVLVTAETRKALSKKVKELNWRADESAYSPTGTIYSKSAHLLRAYKIDPGLWCGVVVMGAYRDV